MWELADYRKLVDGVLSDRRHHQTTINEEKERKKELLEKVANLEEVQTIIQTVAESVQRHAHRKIAEVVTSALQTVFDDPYEFQIEFEKKRGKTEAKLWFVRNKIKVSPKDVGGGVLDVAGFALRIAALLLTKPPSRKVLILDEPFRFLSKRNDYRERVKELLMRLSTELKIQFVLVTHADELQIGKVIEL